MTFFLLLLLAPLWFSVAFLCVNDFVDIDGSRDDWESLPFLLRAILVATAPLWFLWWSR